MEIIIGKYSGFCSGVKYTVNKANKEVDFNKNVYCLGEIVHNERVINDLEKKGMITINDLSLAPDYSKVIFRAHGESALTYQKASLKNLDIIDLTCGKIRIIREKIIKEKDDSFILIIGKKNHPETIGTLSFAGLNSLIIENKEDLLTALDTIKNSNLNKLYITSQTTFSSSKFDEIVDYIKNNCSLEIKVDKSICDATEKRQNEVRELSKEVDKMIIIGGKNSSNTKELYLIAKDILDYVYLIQDVDDLDLSKFKSSDKVGIMGGASTPNSIIIEVQEKLNSLI